MNYPGDPAAMACRMHQQTGSLGIQKEFNSSSRNIKPGKTHGLGLCGGVTSGDANLVWEQPTHKMEANTMDGRSVSHGALLPRSYHWIVIQFACGV